MLDRSMGTALLAALLTASTPLAGDRPAAGSGATGPAAAPADDAASRLLPAPPERLDPAVLALARRHAEAAAAAADPGAALAELAMVYEANGLWPEARDAWLGAIEADPRLVYRLHLAIAERQAGDFEAALARLRRIASESPAFAPAQQRLGLALLEIGEVEAAERAFRRVVEQLPEAPEGYAGLGEAALRRRDWAAAAELLEGALDLAPDDRAARYALGLAYRGLGREEEAERQLARGVGDRPRLLPDELSERIAAYAVHLTARIERAAEHLAAGRPDRAAALLEEALPDHPRNLSLLNNLAAAYLRQERLEEAFELLSRALAIDDRRFSTYLNLSSWATRAGRPDEALRYAEAAVERAPDVGRTHLARARHLARAGRWAEAAGSLESAVRRDARDPSARLLLADVYQRLGRQEEAYRHHRATAGAWPELLPAWLGLARSALELGRLAEAADALARANALAPGHPAAARLDARLAAERSRKTPP